MPPSAIGALGLSSPPTQEELGRLVGDALELGPDEVLKPLGLARAAREFAANATAPTAWSRFMAKMALAAGRETFGEQWLDGPHAAILSADVLDSGEPRFAQRTHYPPVQPVWPYEPPKHQAWVEYHEGTASLMIVLFGQIIGSVPVSDQEPPLGCYSAWTLDPLARTFRRSSYPAVWQGTAAARLTREGHDVLTVAGPGEGFMYVADGPSGPAELPIFTIRAESPSHAFRLLSAAREQNSGS